MQDYKEIIERIRENANKAHKLEDRNKEIYRDRTKDDEYAKNAEEIETLFLVNKILSDNARQSAIATILPVFAELINKYKGKQYGEKTKRKIAEEMMELTGFRVYLYETHFSQEIHFMNDFFGYTNTKLELCARYHAEDPNRENILDGNRICPFDPNEWYLSYCADYVDDVIERVYAIKSARQTAKTAYEQAEQAFKELNKLVPSSVDNVYPNTFRGYF